MVRMAHEWLGWLKDLYDLESIRIPRCVKPAEYTNDNAYLELHHFSDASQKAYGSCSFLRCVNKKGQTKVSLIMSKSRVAPLNKLFLDLNFKLLYCQLELIHFAERNLTCHLALLTSGLTVRSFSNMLRMRSVDFRCLWRIE